MGFRFYKPGPLLINYFSRIFISISSYFIYLIFLQFFFFLAALCDMWDLSLLTRDQICTLHWKHRALTTGLLGKSLNYLLTT